MPSSWARHVEREAALKAAEEYDSQQKAETERLLAAHYHRRRNGVASGFVVEHRKMPRGWHHALAARHPVTRRSFLPPRAIVLLNALYEEAEKIPASTGARRVFGKSQGFYAKKLGLSMRRNRNGEANGARRVREYLKMLSQLNIIKKGGRCWFDGPGKHPRLVLWIQPFEEWTLTRFAEAVNTLPPSENAATPAPVRDETDRISGSGCFTDPLLLDPEVCEGMGGTGGKEAPTAPSFIHMPSTTPVDNSSLTVLSPTQNKERPPAASQDRPSAGANEGDRASPAPTAGAKLDAAKVVMLLGAAALRTFRGPELAELIQHVARTSPRPVDAADGRAVKLPSPSDPGASDATPAPPSTVVGPRPHRSIDCPGGAEGCPACREWLAAVLAAPKPMSSEPRPPAPAQRSPVAQPPAPLPPEHASPANLGGILAGIAAGASLPSVAHALSRSVRWVRTRCYAPEGRRCRPGTRQPCGRCLDIDFPFRTSVDGFPWKLRYNGPHAPFTLIVDGRELGPVDWPATWRSFGAPTPERPETEDDDGGDHA